jgi:predicted  nucleic acid-binding Zn-ribbon protein
MGNDIVNTNFKLPNRDALAKTSGGVFKLAIIGVVGFAAYVYLLPFLIDIAIGSIEFFISATVALFILWIITKKKFWRALNYYSQWIAEKFLSIAIEMNRWQILYNEVDKQAEDLENTKKQTIMLRGQQNTLGKQISENNQIMREAHEAIGILNNKMSHTTDPDQREEIGLQLSTATNDFTNAKDFIDELTPLLTGITTIVNFNEKLVRRGESIIKNSKAKISATKARYEASAAGSRALSSAQAALNGRADLHSDSMKALESITKEIGVNIGVIQTGIQTTSQILSQNDLRDAAKISLAAKTAEQFDMDSKFVYSDTVVANDVSNKNIDTSGNNKYLDFLKK